MLILLEDRGPGRVLDAPTDDGRLADVARADDGHRELGLARSRALPMPISSASETSLAEIKQIMTDPSRLELGAGPNRWRPGQPHALREVAVRLPPRERDVAVAPTPVPQTVRTLAGPHTADHWSSLHPTARLVV